MTEKLSTDQFLEQLFSEKLSDGRKFDPSIVALIKEHLGTEKPKGTAGKNLAADLIQLAEQRANRRTV